MWRSSRSTSAAAVLLGCALAVAQPGGAAESRRYSRSRVEPVVPAVTLVDHDGSPVALAAELARPAPVLLHFFFTSCATVCPVIAGTVAAAQERLPGVRFLSISIDPEHDTPARLRDYAARFGAGPRWRFLTGRPRDVVAAQDAFDAYRGDKMRHEPATFLRAAPGAAWVRLDGFPGAADLVAEMTALTAGGDPAAGERIYRYGLLPSGEALAGVLQGDVPVAGRAAACATCHRRSGFGGVEGTVAVPPVTAAALFAEQPPPTGLLFRALFQEPLAPQPWSRVRTGSPRPPYTDATLAAALREGRDPAGRALDPLMPRYELSPADAAHLAAYLRTLGAAPPPGVEPERLHFATVIAPDAEPARRAAWLEVAAAYVRWRNAAVPGVARKAASTPGYGEDLTGRRREWVLHVWELGGAEESWPAQLAARLEERPVFALLGGVGGAAGWRAVHDFCERREVPCLFPDTDLPVLDPPGAYTVYFSGGLEAEGEALARHLLDGAADRRLDVVQVYRDDARGRAGARGLRRGLAGARIELTERSIPPGDPLPLDLFAAPSKRDRAVTLVLWLPAADLAALPPPGGSIPTQLFFSGTLLGDSASPLAGGWRERAFVVSPFAPPGEEGPHGYRVRAWLRSRGAAGPAGEERRRLAAHWTLSLADHALAHLGAILSRDAFVEAVEREAEREPNPGVYPRLGLGPGQRVASKSCTVLPLAAVGPDPRLKTPGT